MHLKAKLVLCRFFFFLLLVLSKAANCLRNRTTLCFDFLHLFMVCAQTSAFVQHVIHFHHLSTCIFQNLIAISAFLVNSVRPCHLSHGLIVFPNSLNERFFRKMAATWT